MRPRARGATLSVLTCALVVGLTAGALTAPAVGDNGDHGNGSLELNADILVDGSVGTGAVGDFDIRGRLFSEDVSARAHEQREAGAERLNVIDTLTFEPRDTAVSHEAVRATLFDRYAAETRARDREESDESPILHIVALVAGIPLVMVAGVSLGRLWGRRKRTAQ